MFLLQSPILHTIPLTFVHHTRYCAVTLRNGIHLSGNFRKRRRHGNGLVAFGPTLETRRGVHSVWGMYKNGVLCGPGKARLVPKGHCKDIYSEGIVLEGTFVDGR